jgi:transcriptional antiterminator NusG
LPICGLGIFNSYYQSEADKPLTEKFGKFFYFMETKWYALRVYSGHENKVKSYLESEAKQAGLDDKIKNIVIPSQNIVEMKDGKKKTKTKVFFPGYVLVEMELDRGTQNLILNAPGIISFVGPKNKPQPLRSDEVARILHKIEEHSKIASIPFKVGDPIRVIDGPFNDFTGFVEEVNPEKNKVKVMVSIFGRPTPVELDFLQVELEK